MVKISAKWTPHHPPTTLAVADIIKAVLQILSAATETLSKDGSTSNKLNIVGGSTRETEISQQNSAPEAYI